MGNAAGPTGGQSAQSRALALTSSPTGLAVLVGTVLSLVYLRWSPLSPDLAAQVARSEVVRRAGNVSWWTGWFGGVSLPSYSLIAPASMAAFGVRACGLVAAFAGAVGASVLVRDALRPRAGAIVFAIASIADLMAGRITFVMGLTVGVWALVALRSRWAVLTAVLAVATYLASPLAGLFLGLILLAVVVVDRDRRTAAAVAAACLLAFGGVMAVLFPDTGVMPFTLSTAVPPAVCCLVVATACPQRHVRVSALLLLAALPVFLVVPGAVGGNVARLAWVAAVPIIVACGPLSPRRLAAAILVLVAWPASDLVEQLMAAATPSASRAYYQPLADQVNAVQQTAGPAAFGERVEVVDTKNHFASVYLSGSVALARGWDRQADVADNQLFYVRGQLTAASYHDWLKQLAVGWVALPAARLDYASQAEGRLVDSGLDYLTLAWSDPHWRLYRVADATPLARGATVTAVSTTGITLATDQRSTIDLRVRWSNYLTVIDPTTLQPLPACISDAAGWTRLTLPARETVVLTSRFDPRARFRSANPDCSRDIGR